MPADGTRRLGVALTTVGAFLAFLAATNVAARGGPPQDAEVRLAASAMSAMAGVLHRRWPAEPLRHPTAARPRQGRLVALPSLERWPAEGWDPCSAGPWRSPQTSDLRLL